MKPESRSPAGIEPGVTLIETVRKVDGLLVRTRLRQQDGDPIGWAPLYAGAAARVRARSNEATAKGVVALAVTIPEVFESMISDEARGRTYRLSIEVHGGQPTVVRFGMDLEAGIATEREFRAIGFIRLLDVAIGAAAVQMGHTGKDYKAEDGSGGFVKWAGIPSGRELAAARRPRGRPAVHDLQRVALLHQAAVEAGEPTSKYVARELRPKVQPNHARQLIARARKAGLIAPAGEALLIENEEA